MANQRSVHGAFVALDGLITGLAYLDERERRGALYPLAVEYVRTGQAHMNVPLSSPQLAAALSADAAGMAEQARAHFETALDAEIKSALIREPGDVRRKVIVEIRAGVGGDEATLFARDLYGIYRKYVEAHRWRMEDLEVSTTDVGGFKEVVFAVEGDGAWSKLRFESGGHRVQRVPATEAQGRVHTSAATVAVLPEVEDVEIALRPEDLRIDTMRAGGAGGQHVNKTESAVRITHLPTGLVAICQDDRSQQKNRASALRMLKARVFELEQKKRDAERAAQRKSADAPAVSIVSMDDLPPGTSFATSQPDPHQDAEHGSMRAELRAAVGKLPTRERMVIEMRYFDDVSSKGIALALGLSEARVSQLHAQATRRLRTDLADEGALLAA